MQNKKVLKKVIEQTEVIKSLTNKQIYLLGLIIPVIYLILTCFTIKQYGITVDEPACFDIGHKYLNFYLTGYADFDGSTPAGKGHPDFSINYEDWIVWPFVNTLSAVTCNIFYEKLHILSPIDAHHIIIPFLTAFFLFYLFVFMTTYFNVFIGFASVLALITFPYFFGFTFNNIKDIPQIVFFSSTLLLFAQWRLSKKIKYLYLGFIMWGFCAATKMDAIIIPVLLFLWLLPDIYTHIKNGTFVKLFSAKLLMHILLGFIIMAVIVILSFPPLLPWAYSSRKEFYESALSFVYQLIAYIKIAGVYEPIKWNLYAPTQIAYVTPEAMIVFFFLGLLYTVKKFNTNKLYLLFVIWVFFIVGRHSLPKMNHYCGIRHFLGFVVPFAVIISFGTEFLSNIIYSQFKNAKKTIINIIAGLLFLVPNLYAIIGYHPYEVLYYNYSVGGLKGAQEKHIQWSFDYFLTSYREAGEWIEKNAVKNAYYFGHYDSLLIRYYISRKDLKGIFARPNEFKPMPDTYFVILEYGNQQGGGTNQLEVVHKIERADGKILTIYLFPQNMFKASGIFNIGQNYLNNRMFDQAIVEFKKCLEIYPKYFQANNSLGIAYYFKGQNDLAVIEFNKALMIAPDFTEARRNLQGLLRGRK